MHSAFLASNLRPQRNPRLRTRNIRTKRTVSSKKKHHAFHTAHARAPKLGRHRYTSNLSLHREGGVVASRSYLIKKHQHLKQMRKKNKEKPNGKKKSKTNACRVSNPRPQTQSCTQTIWTGGLLFFSRKSVVCITHGVMASRAVFNEIRMSKKHRHLTKEGITHF